jgi:dihydroflavonol-4-reductase
VDALTYIVTGAAGHFGSHVVQELLARGKSVRALVLRGERCPGFAVADQGLLTECVGDVCDPDSLDAVFEGAASGGFVVVHCAGIVSIARKEDRRVYDVNVAGTANVIDACKRHSAKRLVYVSSVHAIPELPHGQTMREVPDFDPDAVHGYYDKTKAIATRLALDAAKGGLDVVVVHPSGIIGPHGLPTGNMARLFALYLRGKLRVAIHGGYDFVDVRDVAGGIVAAAENGRRGECYILSNRFVALRELFDTLSQVGALKKIRLYLPLWVAKAASPFTELYYRLAHRAPIFTLYSLNTLSGNGVYSHEKATRELGYHTRPLRETLADTVRWFREKRGCDTYFSHAGRKTSKAERRI